MATKTNGKLVTSPRVDKLVAYYIATRNEIKDIKERHAQELAKPEHGLDVLTEKLLGVLKSIGTESARTKFGTVSAQTRDTASCSDPNVFINYVRENDAYELLDRRPNGTACKEHVKQHGEPPPGVKINSVRYVSVRSPAKGEEI
jgi:hypothetical protein